MALLSRRERPPVAVTALMESDERVVGWGLLTAAPGAAKSGAANSGAAKSDAAGQPADAGKPADAVKPTDAVKPGAMAPLAVVATSRGLWWPDADGPRRIGWHLISKAVWSDSALIVTEAEIVDDLLLVDRAPIRVRMAEPRDLPEKVRQRIEASVVYSELAAVAGGSVRFVGRRVPGQDGLSWYARLEGGAVDSPTLREAIELRIERLRAAHTPAS